MSLDPRRQHERIVPPIGSGPRGRVKRGDMKHQTSNGAGRPEVIGGGSVFAEGAGAGIGLEAGGPERGVDGEGRWEGGVVDSGGSMWETPRVCAGCG